MGFYVEQGKGEADRVKWLLDNVEGAKEISYDMALHVMQDHDDLALLVSVENPDFTAVGYAYNFDEFLRFFQASDPRPKRIVAVPIAALDILIPRFPKKGTRDYHEVMRPRRW